VARVEDHETDEGPLSRTLKDRSGSGCVNSLFELIAGKRPLEFRLPEAASRQCVLPTHSRRSTEQRLDGSSQVDTSLSAGHVGCRAGAYSGRLDDHRALANGCDSL
jgi:hypothetical protein